MFAFFRCSLKCSVAEREGDPVALHTSRMRSEPQLETAAAEALAAFASRAAATDALLALVRTIARVDILLAAGVAVDAADASGMTALYKAAAVGSVECLQRLSSTDSTISGRR